MIHESINSRNNERVLINLNQVEHISIRPGQDHINVQFGRGCLRLSCVSSEAANLEYLSIKQCMSENGSASEADQRTHREVHSAGNEIAKPKRGVFAIHGVSTEPLDPGAKEILESKSHPHPPTRRSSRSYSVQEEAPPLEFPYGNAALFEQYEPLPGVTSLIEDRNQAENLVPE
jgi:hypothetical protein